MKEGVKLSISQIGLYNSQRLSDEAIEGLFVARKKLFSFLLNKVVNEKPTSIPQHYLIIAQRGMGKSTILKRIEVELRKPSYNKQFVPLIFAEEQYNLRNLSEFWLNSLDALADTLEIEKSNDVAEIDLKIKELGGINNQDEVAKSAFQFLIDYSEKSKRRPVLLVDNMSFLFDRLDKPEQHQLRAWLMQNGAPIVVGASAIVIEETFDYGAPFYDAFQIEYLKKLSFDELLEILTNLASITDSNEVLLSIHKELPRLKTLHTLTGGNPRTATMLFRLIVRGFTKELNDDLEALLDEITPLYKARFEELSAQMQIIVDAIALHWDPITIEQLRNETRFENNQLSPQLKRLIEVGWIEKIGAYKAKGGAYQISERFFNIWFLMRRSSRRQKKELYCLSKFLQAFYGDELEKVARKRLGHINEGQNHIAYDLALSLVVKDPEVKYGLKERSNAELEKLAEKDPSIKERFSIQKDSDLDEKSFYLEVKIKLLDILKIDETKADIWFELGWLYNHKLNDFFKAESAYRNAINYSQKNIDYWIELASLYMFDLKKYQEADSSFKTALNINPNNIIALSGLAYLNHASFANYKKAEEYYLKAISLSKSGLEILYTLLAKLYTEHFFDYLKAESYFLKSIKIDEKNSIVWNELGHLYHNNLFRYEDAEKAYLNSIKFNHEDLISKHNLIFLYRDSMNRITDAQQLFDSIDISEELADSYNLNACLFELYKRNEGLASDFLLKAFEAIGNDLPSNTKDDWWRFGSVVVKLGYGQWLLSQMEKAGYDKILSPYFVAIRAMTEKDSEGYLNSKAVEIREPARKLVDIMRKL
jgi:tetratricopeptide (TPR) repeat protein